MTDRATKVIYYRDNLDILPRYRPETCVDLVYLDPRNATDAQLLAFEDTSPLCCRPRESRWVVPVWKEQTKESPS